MIDLRTSLLCAVTAIIALNLSAPAVAQGQTEETMRKGAGWGALAGLVFGGRLSDVVEGAVIGGTAGAVVGSSRAQEESARQQAEMARAQQIREEERRAYEREAERRAMLQAQYETRLATEGEQLAVHRSTNQQSTAGPDEAMLIRAFGEDTVTGWYALRDCKHNTALIAATAGENAEAASHQLAAVWLRAVVALDQGRENSTRAALHNLVVIDPDVSSMEEAQAGAQDLLSELHNDRRSAEVNCGA